MVVHCCKLSYSSYINKTDTQFEILLLLGALSDQSLVWGGNWGGGGGSLSNAT